MILTISNEKLIQELQDEFNASYPFLRLDFFKPQKGDPTVPVKKLLPPSTTLKAAGLTTPGIVAINEETTVAEFERIFLTSFGLSVQVSRKSGMLWMATTLTNKWTLHKQNEHGREICLTAINIPPFGPGSEAV